MTDRQGTRDMGYGINDTGRADTNKSHIKYQHINCQYIKYQISAYQLSVYQLSCKSNKIMYFVVFCVNKRYGIRDMLITDNGYGI